MWFRLGAYDKARRLPRPPYLPNYKADTLLNSPMQHVTPTPLSNSDLSSSSILLDTVSCASNAHASVNKQESE
jgi:hypothetical protein